MFWYRAISITRFPSSHNNCTRQTLRRWEIAERQRRKQARLSSLASSSTSTTSTLVGGPPNSPNKSPTSATFAIPEPGTTRRSSILGSLWPSRRPDALHRALSTSEELAGAVRMDDLDQQPHSPGHSRSPTPGPDRRSTPGDPFADPDPNASSASLFVNETPASPSAGGMTPTQAGFKQPPPPEPLDLPQPTTPPPRADTPAVSRPPEPTRAPTLDPYRGEHVEEKPVRWWTEWLCGCREHGEEQVRSHSLLTMYTHLLNERLVNCILQAGRTNPLE